MKRSLKIKAILIDRIWLLKQRLSLVYWSLYKILKEYYLLTRFIRQPLLLKISFKILNYFFGFWFLNIINLNFSDIYILIENITENLDGNPGDNKEIKPNNDTSISKEAIDRRTEMIRRRREVFKACLMLIAIFFFAAIDDAVMDFIKRRLWDDEDD